MPWEARYRRRRVGILGPQYTDSHGPMRRTTHALSECCTPHDHAGTPRFVARSRTGEPFSSTSGGTKHALTKLWLPPAVGEITQRGTPTPLTLLVMLILMQRSRQPHSLTHSRGVGHVRFSNFAAGALTITFGSLQYLTAT